LKPRSLQAKNKSGSAGFEGEESKDLQSFCVSDIRLEDGNVIPRQIIQLGRRSFVPNEREDSVVAVGTKLPDEFELSAMIRLGIKRTNKTRTPIPLAAPVTT
jgi:hypothetical protein